ncbi:MAG: 50S ribosome-binding GTPase, partial [Gammaproteobacteria bacterium]|nr:50S ribosome-binding GTPase [Gammaproteobacteria bacterium]
MDAARSTATLATPVVVTVGNPNTGKSTLFNLLTGLRQKVSNYPGVTVEQVSGHCDLGGITVRVVDVPGTYSLAAMSPDEIVTVDVLRGAVPNLGMPDAVIVVIDATNLRRNLFLASQILEAGVPTVIALNMVDRLALEGIEIDHGELSRRLDCPVVPISATQGTGLAELKQAVIGVLEKGTPPDIMINPVLGKAALELAENVSSASHRVSALEASRALVDGGGYAEARLVEIGGSATVERLKALRHKVGGGRNLATLEARDRYSWIHAQLAGVEHRSAGATRPIAEFLDRVVNHPISGTLLFVLVMATVFQAVFACAGPLVDAINVL